MTSISIIGFGPVGVSVLIALLDKLIHERRSLLPNIEINIVEKSPQSGGNGLVFGTELDCHVLNSPSHVMTLINGKPNDFLDWLNGNPGQWRGRYPSLDVANEEYLPRSLFGLYVEARKHEALKLARKHGIRLNVIDKEAVNIGFVDSRQRIVFGEGDCITTDYAVLCLGLLPASGFSEFIGNERYFHSPWPSSKLTQGIPEGEDVAILGTRASAIDTVLTFYDRGHRGKLYMASRSGHLPRIIGPYTPGALKFIDASQIEDRLKASGRKLTLSELFSAIGSEMEHRENRTISWHEEIASWLNIKNPYEREIGLLSSGVRRPWQSVLSDIYLRIPDLWQALDQDGKVEFVEKYLSLWLVFQDAIPLKNAKIIHAMIRDKRLEVLGGFQGLTYCASSKRFGLLTKPQISESDAQLTVSYVVNSTGLGSDIRVADSVLLRNLVSDGKLLPDRFGGAEVSPVTFSAKNADGASSGIYVVGDLTRGAWLFTATLGRGRRQGNLALEDILGRIDVHPQRERFESISASSG